MKNDDRWFSAGSLTGPTPMPPLPLSNAEHIVVVEFMKRKLAFVFAEIVAWTNLNLNLNHLNNILNHILNIAVEYNITVRIVLKLSGSLSAILDVHGVADPQGSGATGMQIRVYRIYICIVSLFPRILFLDCSF